MWLLLVLSMIALGLVIFSLCKSAGNSDRDSENFKKYFED